MKTFWKVEKVLSPLGLAHELETPPSTKLSLTEFFQLIDDYGLMIYRESKVKTPIWIRLTLPIALVVMLTLFLLMPVNYMITGHWGYKIEPLTNWLRSLGF
jgi:hypothetical protein